MTPLRRVCRFAAGSEPLSEALFASHVWWCFDQLRAQSTPDLGLPPYFYFLTLVALRAFHAAAVDAVVLEVGLGGRWDATNVVPASSVAACGVAALGYDHMELLGHNLGAIAAEKAGIFKPGVPAFSVPQPAEAAAVVAAAAASVGAPLTLVAPLHAAVRLGLAGHHQRGNAALAVALAGAWERRHGGPGAAARVAVRASRTPRAPRPPALSAAAAAAVITADAYTRAPRLLPACPRCFRS